MNNQKDYTTMKNETAIRRQAKKDALEILYKLLADYFGEDAVCNSLKNETTKDSHEIAFCMGVAPDKDGCPMDLCFTIDPTVKPWMFKTRKSKDGDVFTYKPFNLDVARAEYEEAVERVKKEKEEKAAQKKKKIEKDKATREKAVETTEE